MIPILSHTAESYTSSITSQLNGKGSIYAKLVYKTWVREGKLYHEEGNAQKLISQIIALTDFSHPSIAVSSESDETQKIILKAHDDKEFEMVLLPMQSGLTLCISSQVGCRIGCAFCQTAKMGLIRSLSAGEIVSQLFIANQILQKKVRNIVFMGMGEPFDNYIAVMQAVAIFTDMNGFAMGPRHITISTSGLTDKIDQFSLDAHPALNLAVSVNAPTDEKRQKLMPINKTFDMNALRISMEKYLETKRREILIEYVMIKDKNDSDSDAENLALYLKGLRVKINLIPYNKQKVSVFQTPERERIDEFAAFLRKQGFAVLIRHTKGERIMASCGQLGKRAL